MNPQLENGYTQIANEILEALCKFRIPGEQMQCLLVIIRKTYGYGKKFDVISNSQFVKETGLKKANVSRAIAELSKKQLVIKSDNGKIPTYRFNKDYSQWKVLSKLQPVIKSDNGKIPTYRFNKDYSQLSKLQPVINITTTVIKSDNKLLSKVMDTKEKKKNTTKERKNTHARVLDNEPQFFPKSILPDSPKLNILQQQLFQMFWDSYPKQIDRIDAEWAFHALDLNQDQVINKILPSIEQHRMVSWKEFEFIPAPATFLKKRKWENKLELVGDLPAARSTPGATPQEIMQAAESEKAARAYLEEKRKKNEENLHDSRRS